MLFTAQFGVVRTLFSNQTIAHEKANLSRGRDAKPLSLQMEIVRPPKGIEEEMGPRSPRLFASFASAVNLFAL